MGACFSADTKVSGGIVPTRLRPIGQPQKQQQPQPEQNNQAPREKQQQNDRGNKRRPCGLLSCGKRTDFGYAKDFESRYSIGKLLGHGQFGYTFVATENSTEERVAVKRIDKSKGQWEASGRLTFADGHARVRGWTRKGAARLRQNQLSP
ncbi:calcium-dependent protein kinase 16-like isoform X1 [Musa acuminata AAA Group]|uniref:calcium-dependent protein kinase 16-like isoform X1 n=1 Tax=Musa acuminata AAA Group TaxID=214697 RepID=UPI0031D97378